MFGLKDKAVEKIHSVFTLFPQVEKVIIYGSRAKGTSKPGSDIDLVLIGENLNLSVLCSIDNRLEDLYLPYTFDTSVYNNIKENAVLEHIQRAGVVLYERTKISK